MANAIDEYYKLKAQLGEPILELETETSVNEKRKVGRPPKTEIAPKLNRVVEQVTKTYDITSILNLLEQDKKHLLERQNVISTELEDIEIKIAGINYVVERISALKE